MFTRYEGKIEMNIKNCPACNADGDEWLNYIEVYTNASTRIVRSADKKKLYFVESAGGDLYISRYNCDSCKRSFEEQEDGTVKVLERDEK